MPRIYKRFHPKGSKYERKTEWKHGREIVKPIDRKDFDEMIRLCLVYRDKYPIDSPTYFKWYRNYIIMIVGVNTGNRITTIIEQTPRDYAGTKYTITEHKTGKRQQFELNPQVYSIVKKYIDAYGFTPNEFMFPNKKGGKDAITRISVWKFMKKLAHDAGIEYPIACHSLRKSYGRWKWEETHDLAMVQSLLMHDSAEETMRYICLEHNEIEKERSKIAYIPKYE